MLLQGSTFMTSLHGRFPVQLQPFDALMIGAILFLIATISFVLGWTSDDKIEERLNAYQAGHEDGYQAGVLQAEELDNRT
jgi:hypothetical protein